MSERVTLIRQMVIQALAEVKEHNGLPPGDFETKDPGATSFTELVSVHPRSSTSLHKRLKI